MSKTFASMFTGGGLADVGATMAGCTPIWGIEIEPAIAEVAKANLGHEILVQSVCDVDPKTLEKPDILWASPVCVSFSVAKANRQELAIDIASSAAVCRFISTLQPPAFILENVELYKNSESLQAIVSTLWANGYFPEIKVLNAADFGVPQTRRRLILVAVKGMMLPPPDSAKKWVGWYQAVEDLIPDLPETQLADWQIDRLPEHLVTLLFQSGNPNGNRIEKFRRADYPACTVCASESLAKAVLVPGSNAGSFAIRQDEEPSLTIGDTNRPGNAPRALLMNRNQSQWGDIYRESDEAAYTVCAEGSNGRTRALLLDVANTIRDCTVREEGEPSVTVTAEKMRRPASTPKALLIQSKNSNQEFGDGSRGETEPAMTVTTDGKPSHQPKAVLVSGADAIAPCDREPSMTITASLDRQALRAIIAENAKVVQMTSRALARFQTLPDSYELPAKNTLACKIIGNGVPCILARDVIRHVLPYIDG